MARKHTEPRSYPGTEAGAAAAPVRRTATHKKSARPSAEQFETATTAVTLPAVESQPSAVSTPDPEEIARLAYSLWEARGGEHGFAQEDWLRAEQELRLRKNH